MEISHHKSSRPYQRKLTINKEVWSYRIAGTFVAIRSPNGNTTIKTNAFEIHGTTQDEWLESDNEFPSSIDKSPNPPITPALIRICIEQHKQGKRTLPKPEFNIANGSEGKFDQDEDPNWYPEGSDTGE